jgi:16S rRNA processing protein RimM
MKNDDLVEIARIHGPHGLKGKMRITPFGDSFERFQNYSHLIIGPEGIPAKVISSEQKKNAYIIELEGYDSIDQVEKLKGLTIYVKRDQLEDLEKDEYYWRDIIGLKVLDENGRELGEVVEIFATGSNDVYVVDRIKQYLIPATRDVVKEISLEKGCMVIDASLLEGLLD